MAKRDFEKLVLQVRLDTKEKALQGAILVPWRRLQENATTYAEWHIFVLWVRTIAEHEDQLPEIVRSALAHRCPGFLESRQEQASAQRFLWHSLEEWMAAHEFAEPKTEGWFDAVMYYAYKDLRTEQAWSLWERTKDAWNHKRPSQWPTLEEWTAQVIATHTLTQAGTEKALSVEALARVEHERIQGAAAELLVSRAVALWVACISQPNRALDEFALEELRQRYPGFLTASCPQPLWNKSLFFRLVRFGEAYWRATARAERWDAVLRYQVIHHPRYHRVRHYHQVCQEQWLHVRPYSYPSFADWLDAADEYCLGSRL